MSTAPKPLPPSLPLSQLQHDCTLLVDTNLVIKYSERTNEHWNNWVDEHFRKGKSIYVPVTAALEFKPDRKASAPLPTGFKVYSSSQMQAEAISQIVDQVSTALNLSSIPLPNAKQSAASRFKNDLTILLEASNIGIVQKPDSGRPSTETRNVFASSNMKFLKRCVGSKKKYEAISDLLADCGFDTLAKPIYVGSDGWIDWLTVSLTILFFVFIPSVGLCPAGLSTTVLKGECRPSSKYWMDDKTTEVVGMRAEQTLPVSHPQWVSLGLEVESSRLAATFPPPRFVDYRDFGC